MRRSVSLHVIAVALLSLSPLWAGGAERAPESVASRVSVHDAIAAVARSTGKRFMVDPRVVGEVGVVGADASQLTYDDLLVLLQIGGFAALEKDGFVRVIPDAQIRQQPVHIVSESDARPAAEIATLVVTIRNRPATELVPILRPLLPQFAHLVADPFSNSLVIVDAYANARRIEALARSLDTVSSYKALTPREPAKSKHADGDGADAERRKRN